MAKTKQDQELYGRMREAGVRKKVARQLNELPAHVEAGKQAPKPLRDAVDRLEATVSELRDHVSSGDRKAAARKAARTRATRTQQRSASARKGARKRAKAS